MARLVPKGCIVHSVELDGRGNAHVRYRCADDRGQNEYRSGDTVSNYPSKNVKARTLRFRGMSVSGNARAHFVLSPANAVCHKRGQEIDCHLVGDTSSASLRGVRGKKKRRRR